MSARTAVGIDIGGTGIKAARVDLDTGELLTARTRIPTPRPATPDAVRETVARVLDTGDLRGPEPVGVGFPAVIKEGRALTATNLDASWVGMDVRTALEPAVGRPIAVLNDADAAGVGELRLGAGRDCDGVVVIVTLGTGIGCGYFTGGVLGPNVSLGQIEIRGKRAERRASDSARVRRHRGWKAWAGDVQAFLEELDRLTWPDLVIIGGGVSKKADRFLPLIRVRPMVVPAKLGNLAGIVGAAVWAAEHQGIDAQLPIATEVADRLLPR